MRKIIKNNYKFILGIIVGLILSIGSVYALDAYIESKKVSYNNKYTDKNNTQEAIDELYERSRIHKEKWIDPVLNGADPVLKDPLIPVEIKPNGDVYYASENSEWYNYSEKKWANAVILTDTASKYTIGQQILEKDIESYFVWIPRYQYKVWNDRKYTKAMTLNELTNDEKTATAETSLWRITGNNTRIIDIKFGSADKIAKMNESEASIGEYYTHPAFTLGEKSLNGFWMAKFETGYKGAESTGAAQVDDEEPTSIIIKPNVYSWRGISVKNIFMNSYNYKRDLDSHMLKNTEWGAVAYLSHSKYGIGNEVNINNASDYKTGYSAASNTDQSTHPSESAPSSEINKTQPWNSPDGYLASTTGNISGVYDMSGGTLEYMAACMEGIPLNSGFDANTLASEMEKGYIDKYDKSSLVTTYNYRILGDATGELGPFYNYYENDAISYNHSSWYSDIANFVGWSVPWVQRGGYWSGGAFAGQFYFDRYNGVSDEKMGFRLALALTE